MGIFDSMFRKKEKDFSKEVMIDWKPLVSKDQLKEIHKESEAETVIIFKHSTRCGISRMVKSIFEKMFDSNMKKIKVYYLDLLSHREVSDEVGFTYQVVHQSPQVIIIQNGIAVEHASHYDITLMELNKYSS